MRNLTRTRGPEVTVVLETLVDRLDEVAGTEAGQLALATLEDRGLTPARLDEVRRMPPASQLAGRLASDGANNQDGTQRLAEHERTLWAWYVEWSTVARAVIASKRDLRRLGFGT